jgi:general secretion pathway protein G
MGKQKTGQRGFSLMELMIALTIMGILAVLGMRAFTGQSDKARHMKAYADLQAVQKGIAEYYMQTGNYPELSSWEAMISANSPLVKKNMLPVNIPINDPWGTPYEGKSTKGTFEIKCVGSPNGNEETGLIMMTQNGEIGGPAASQEQSGKNAQSAPAQGAAPQ